jgi:hypothetical protein
MTEPSSNELALQREVATLAARTDAGGEALRRALGGWALLDVELAGLAAAAGVAALASLLRWARPDLEFWARLSVGATLLALGLSYAIWRKRAPAAGLRWVRALPERLPVSVDDYLLLLERPDERSRARSLQVEVRLRDDASPEERDAALAALQAKVPLSAASWLGARILVLHGPHLSTQDRNASGRPGRTHARLHAWFVRCADDGLVTLHERHPVTSLSFLLKE